MVVFGLGDNLVLMQGFARQKAIASDPKKKARSIALRRYVVPSETAESLPARLCLAEAAQRAYGGTFEDVIATVVRECSGKDYGGKAKAATLRDMHHAQATANIARMRSKLATLRTTTPRAMARAPGYPETL
jgi:hypothetical protein